MTRTPSDVLLVRNDFIGDVSYPNKVMKNMRYRLIRDKDMILIDGTDYNDKTGGGFDLISFKMGDDTTVTIQFY